VAEILERRVMVVDDDPFVLELLLTRLTLAGYRTYSARDGQEAIERVGDIRPEALVLDINMPRLDGFGVLRHLSASGQGERVSTMVLTARNHPQDVQMAIRLGARDYMAKPFRDDQLLARVARLLRKRSGGAIDNSIEI
jgi:DNA-binding response OmpR family regulator